MLFRNLLIGEFGNYLSQLDIRTIRNFLSHIKPKHLLLLLILPIAITVFVLNKSPLLSPLGASRILGLTQTNLNRPVVFGFLPYWNYKYADALPYHKITHLALFGVGLEPDGSFQTREADYTEPGWNALNKTTTNDIIRKSHRAGGKVILTLRAFDADLIDSIIYSDKAIQTLVDQSISFLDSKNLDGINIDFEYSGSTNQATKDRFTSFVSTYTTALKQHNSAWQISTSVYADASLGNRVWDIPELSQTLDHIFIMAYDFHRASSATAAPVAPLYGAGVNWARDITSLLKLFLEQSPPEKLILGVPFYGYEWSTTSDQYLAGTYQGSGATASYNRIQAVIAQQDPQIYRYRHQGPRLRRRPPRTLRRL